MANLARIKFQNSKWLKIAFVIFVVILIGFGIMNLMKFKEGNTDKQLQDLELQALELQALELQALESRVSAQQITETLNIRMCTNECELGYNDAMALVNKRMDIHGYAETAPAEINELGIGKESCINTCNEPGRFSGRGLLSFK